MLYPVNGIGFDRLFELTEPREDGGPFRPVHRFRRELGESGGERVRVPCLEKDEIFGRRHASVLFDGVIHAVFPCHAVKGTDVTVGDFDVRHARVLPDELLSPSACREEPQDRRGPWRFSSPFGGPDTWQSPF